MYESYFKLKPRCGSFEFLRRLAILQLTYIGLYAVVSQKYEQHSGRLHISLKDSSKIIVEIHGDWIFIAFNLRTLTIRQSFIQIIRGLEEC